MKKERVYCSIILGFMMSVLFMLNTNSHKLYSQEVVPVMDTTVTSLLGMELPPLQVFFDGARNSAMVEFYNYRMEGQELTLKTERRKWQEYVSFFATYQYGIMAMNTNTDIGFNYPLVNQYTASEQSWYNFGASIRVPLDQLFDRRNRIRRQQLKILETTKERELWYDEQKFRIIEEYTKVLEMSNNLKYAIEMFSLADAQYIVAQKDYIIGSTSAQGLNNAKGQQVQAFLQLERIKAELTASILKLEVLSGVKIINR
jgi:hypothetical protein